MQDAGYRIEVRSQRTEVRILFSVLCFPFSVFCVNLCNLVVIKKKNKNNLKFLLLPVTLLLLILIIHNIGFANLYSTIVRANLGYLILAVVLQASSILVRNLKWQIFVNGIKKKSALLFPISHVTCRKLYGYLHTRTAGRGRSTKSVLPVEEDKGEQGYLSLYGFGRVDYRGRRSGILWNRFNRNSA